MNKPALLLTLAAATVAALCFSLPVPAAVQAQATPTIHISAPANGATVSNPVTVAVQSSGVTIKPAAAGDPNAAHYHYFIDRNPATVLQQGQPIPTGQPDIIHTDSANQQLPTLSPGQHTVWVVLAHTDHTPYNPNVQDQASFTVAAPGQAAAASAPQAASAAAPPLPPATGRGGLLARADQRQGIVPAVQRTAADNPWLPVLGLVTLALALGGAGVYCARRAEPEVR